MLLCIFVKTLNERNTSQWQYFISILGFTKLSGF